MKSVMKHQFSQVPKATIPRSSFDRTHGLKTTFDSGYLVPILVDEALPGDTFSLNVTAFARMATPIYPVMDNLYMSFYFFAVPHRLVWQNWEKFCGAQTDPGDSTDYTVPVLSGANAIDTGMLADYMGLPLGLVPNTTDVNALPFRAVRLIWNEWFRDQNLQDSLSVPVDDGPDTNAEVGFEDDPLKRGKPHDYFTSALPWPQKGDSVDIPLGGNAPVVSTGSGNSETLGILHADGATAKLLPVTSNSVIASDIIGAPDQMLQADLSAATASTINQLRQAFQIQKLLERDARGGTRYTEVIRAHFGVTSPDARLQRPEYLGGGRTRININPVPQTSNSDTGISPQGNLAAFATASARGIGFRKSFTEHCVILGFVCVTADLTYQQGLARMWSRQTRYDYYWPALANIGEQAVLNKEIWHNPAGTDNDDVFAYQERFAEYRYAPSRITGVFRSDATGTLDAWHLSQDFASLPALDSTFIEESPPVDRVVAVTTEPQFLFDSYFSMRCVRPMPLYGVPGNIDRF